MKIQLSEKYNSAIPQILLFKKIEDLKEFTSKTEFNFLLKPVNDDQTIINLSVLGKTKYAVKYDKTKDESFEVVRKSVADLGSVLKGEIEVVSVKVEKDAISALIEGIALTDYKFDKYLTSDSREKLIINILNSKLKVKDLSKLKNLLSAVFSARDWVNEPVNKLDTDTYLKNINKLKSLGVTVDVFRKSKIQSLNMGGVMAVNQGSLEEPAFVVIEWKPKSAKNSKPVVLVGKGILFDTGGINIKVGTGMTDMKADMGGSAAVIGAIKAVASNKLPIHIITLVPITENRINGKEIVPGDVITMHNGKTVEILNTDAEGRLVLADALSFAKKYKPSLVIDAATLTGSAFRTTGHHGGVIMGNDSASISELKEAGDKVYERLVELPMWGEFEDSLKSEMADLNNLGAGPGQAVCAGFFLKNFIDYPWVHLDIAGPAFIPSKMTYKQKGGTGFGVRLLYQFLKDKFEIN
jgi:leucyl aminopeptidase